MIDEETLKFAVGNAYEEGQKDGLSQGKLLVFKALREKMEKQGLDEVPLQMIRDFENHFKKERDEQTN